MAIRRALKFIGFIFLATACTLASVAIAPLVASSRSNHRGVEDAEAMLRGENSVRLSSLEIEYQQRCVRCSEPATLRYIERCIRENEPAQLDDRTTYLVRLGFENGGVLEARTDWGRPGFLLCMPGDRLLQDGGEPRACVVFRSPMPTHVHEMIEFLLDDSGKSRGTVLVIEPDGIRRASDSSLLR